MRFLRKAVSKAVVALLLDALYALVVLLFFVSIALMVLHFFGY